MSGEERTPETAQVVPPTIIPVPDVACTNCGVGLAWRVGVGRYVISHVHGSDVCSRATVRMADEDREAAVLAYRKADKAFALALSTPPGATP